MRQLSVSSICVKDRRIANVSRIAASRHGADVVLHHLGESTLEDTQAVKREIESNGRKAILVAGDIGDPATATKVSSPNPTATQL